MEIIKLEEKLTMLKRSSDRDVQDTNQAPYLPAGLDLDNPKLSFYTESQRRSKVGAAPRPAPRAPVAAAADLRPSQYLSNGSQKRNKVYHDTDIRLHKPPFRGKVKMTSEEWTRNQITTSQFLSGDRFNPNNICSNCGHAGHWLGDCVFPDDNGTIMGCPVHNTKLHVFDDCRDLPYMTLQQRVTTLVVRRRNKPAIRSRKPWIELVKEAMGQGLEELV
ncbi:hypothetical protein BDP81DRAFT_448319 [Colletotrichum phormii]|uniref:CCHC-type domain-containing protein n=1 Tax=Colletotrichum phormii TaxID=359342 RepID=A0AAJ0EGQ8_9PEZI|nr:uncharacterized protein BDP81DRAFT_448319 [Colletotrichum phormii]KAK1638244.1 hypothetical protein BDP81DRAFT_448319 [Colletotrichum phormii]